MGIIVPQPGVLGCVRIHASASCTGVTALRFSKFLDLVDQLEILSKIQSGKNLVQHNVQHEERRKRSLTYG